ncbi:hypothetical protein F5B17DRAFT_416543 [Nemania serpens]|nr:hypothetical protein F5B17DRAFT_416543 [Nemania serpens]
MSTRLPASSHQSSIIQLSLLVAIEYVARANNLLSKQCLRMEHMSNAWTTRVGPLCIGPSYIGAGTSSRYCCNTQAPG